MSRLLLTSLCGESKENVPNDCICCCTSTSYRMDPFFGHSVLFITSVPSAGCKNACHFIFAHPSCARFSTLSPGFD